MDARVEAMMNGNKSPRTTPKPLQRSVDEVSPRSPKRGVSFAEDVKPPASTLTRREMKTRLEKGFADLDPRDTSLVVRDELIRMVSIC